MKDEREKVIFAQGNNHSPSGGCPTECHMGNFTKQQEERKEVREREKLSRETLGKFFYALAKITFTALVVGSVASIITGQEQLEYWLLMAIGTTATCLLAYIGYKTIKL